ncbi:MAG: rRNA pseudouridine synthase [Bacteroidia bacterium]|nr:rRNA pseudouridine synthase [Bacteroidia bacterium]
MEHRGGKKTVITKAKNGNDKPARQKPAFKKNNFNKDKPSKQSLFKKTDDSMRLNRYLANAGICSRRQADDYILSGVVTINGKVITELGTKVYPGDVVKFNNESIRQERKVYILLNKPKDYITTAEDDRGRKSVLELIRGACKERVMPVGRLDRNTTGILLLTNDGELAAKLIHPRSNKKKIYHVFLDKNIKKDDMDAIATGIELDDGFIKADEINYADPVDKSQIGIEVHSGRNHLVRRIFEHFGYKVIKLDRVYFAGLTKKALPRGRWRFLTPDEVSMIKMGAFE